MAIEHYREIDGLWINEWWVQSIGGTETKIYVGLQHDPGRDLTEEDKADAVHAVEDAVREHFGVRDREWPPEWRPEVT